VSESVQPKRGEPLVAMLGLALFAFGLEAAIAVLSLRGGSTSLSALGVYHDGHLYLEIARSFPLPYSADGSSYVGQAPGYPALIYLIRILTPDAWVNWGMAALLASWLPAALCAPAFYALCGSLGWRPFWPTLLFVVANPRWLSVAATPHTEPLAMLFAILCLTAYQRRRLGWCVAFLSFAILTRFPALLLGLPIAFGTLVVRRERGVAQIATLAVPLLAFGLFNLYLLARVPGFEGIWAAHQIFWQTEWTWPFASLLQPDQTWSFFSGTAAFYLTYASVAGYLISCALSLRSAERERWHLGVWVGVLLLFHVSLGGQIGTWDLTRLAILAWPAAMLALWGAVVVNARPIPLAVLSTALLGIGVWFALGQTRLAVSYQTRAQPYLAPAIERLDADMPQWIDFEQRAREQR
jgi:hypothetical protein